MKTLLYRFAVLALLAFSLQANVWASFSTAPPLFEHSDPDHIPDNPHASLPDLIQRLEQRSTQHPDDAEIYYQLGLAYAKSDRTHDAVGALQKAVSLDPVHVRAWENLGRVLYFDHKPDEALAAFTRATDLGAENPEVWNDYAIILMEKGRLDDGSAALDKGFKLNPKRAQLWNSLGNLKEKRYDFPGAIEAFQQALQIDPNYAIGWCNLGLAQKFTHNDEAALASFQKAAQLDPKLEAGWVNIALECGNRHQYGDALQAAQQAVQCLPNDPGAWFALGDAEFGLHKWADAERDFEKAFDELDPAPFLAEGDTVYGDSLCEYGLACVTIGHLEDAEKILTRAMQLDPQDPRVLSAMGELRLHQKRWEEARDLSQKSVDIAPSVPRTWANLATALMGLNRPPAEALQAYEKATALQPNFDAAWWGAGQANEMLHQMDAAEDDYRKAVQANPNMLLAWQRLAVVAKDPAESDKAMEQAIAVAPSDVPTYLLFGAVKAGKKAWHEAEKYDRKATDIDSTNGTAWAQLAQALYAQKDPGAVAAWEKATQFSSGVAPVEVAKWWSGLAIAHINQGKESQDKDKAQIEWQAGRDASTHATVLDPSGPVYWWELAVCQKELGHAAESSAAAQRCAQLGGPPWAPVHPVLTSSPATNSGGTPAPPEGVGAGSTNAAPVNPLAGEIAEANAIKQLVRDHRMDEALAAAQHETEVHPDHAVSWYALGDVEMAQNHYDAAVAALTKATTINPKSGPSWFDLANSLAGQKNIDEAIDAYSKAIDLMPDFPTSWEGILRCYYFRHDLVGAADKVEGLATAHPTSPFGWWALGNIQTQQGMPSLALASLQKAADLNGNYAPIWNDLGMAYGRGGQTEKAQECFNRSLQVQPGYVEALNNLGYTYFLQGQTDKAIDEYKEALQSNPKHTRALYNLTSAYAKENQWDLARQTCATLAQIDPQTAAQLSQSLSIPPAAPVTALPEGAIPSAPTQ
jgi:tetratricopeptide (TPR) repeat protein